MAVSEDIANRRDYLVEWLKPELKILPVTIDSENDSVFVRLQDLLICGIQVSDETYRIFNVSNEWSNETTYHCEQGDDKYWFYYLESADECISECKRLVIFEAKKGNARDNKNYSSLPIEDEYWQNKFRDLLGNTVNEKKSGYKHEAGKDQFRYECYGTGPENRMRVYLHNATAKDSEIISVWIGQNVVPSVHINPGKRNMKSSKKECNIKFRISTVNRQKDIDEVLSFLEDIMNKHDEFGTV